MKKFNQSATKEFVFEKNIRGNGQATRTSKFTDAIKGLNVGESLFLTDKEWSAEYHSKPHWVLPEFCQRHPEYGQITIRIVKGEGWLVIKTALIHPDPKIVTPDFLKEKAKKK